MYGPLSPTYRARLKESPSSSQEGDCSVEPAPDQTTRPPRDQMKKIENQAFLALENIYCRVATGPLDHVVVAQTKTTDYIGIPIDPV